HAIPAVANTASDHHIRLRGPTRVKSRMTATAVAPAKAECPDGNDAPLGWTRGAGGRGRSTSAFVIEEISGVSASVSAKAASDHRRLATKSTAAGAAIRRARPTPRPRALKTSAM